MARGKYPRKQKPNLGQASVEAREQGLTYAEYQKRETMQRMHFKKSHKEGKP